MNGKTYKYERNNSTSNDVRWADPDEFKNAATIKQIHVDAGECPACGLPVISDGRTVYVDNSDTHTIILGSTGSKKTRNIVMPLLNMAALAGESVIVTDPKGEIYDACSGFFASMGYEQYVLNFRDPAQSDCWNPLFDAYKLYHSGKTDQAVSLLNDFINICAEPQKMNVKDTYFIDNACSYFLAYLLVFIETALPVEVNISNFFNFFLSHSSPEATEEICQCLAERSIASLNLMGVLTNKIADKTFANVASCVSVMLNPFITRRALCQLLSKSSFDTKNITQKKTVIFVIVPDEKTSLHFLVTAFIKQTYEMLIYEAQQQETKKIPVRLNYILDEFGNIPTVADMPAMISAARSRNIRFFLCIQDIQQLIHKYGNDANTIMGNCENWVFLISRDIETLQRISNLCGGIKFYDADGKSDNRPLISISELQHLQKGEALIIHGRHYPLVSLLPDISEYCFKTYPKISLMRRQLPSIIPFNIDILLAEIKKGEKPLLFWAEVSDHEIFIDNKKEKEKDTIFDW